MMNLLNRYPIIVYKFLWTLNNNLFSLNKNTIEWEREGDRYKNTNSSYFFFLSAQLFEISSHAYCFIHFLFSLLPHAVNFGDELGKASSTLHSKVKVKIFVGAMGIWTRTQVSSDEKFGLGKLFSDKHCWDKLENTVKCKDRYEEVKIEILKCEYFNENRGGKFRHA